MADANVKCANPDCRVAEDGKCVEGYELAKCPFYGKSADEVTLATEESAETAAPQANGVALSLGISLDATGASDWMRRSLSNVIGIVGSFDSGKTSLIAGLYDLFQLGSVANVTFAGSATLHAFEQVCHDARAASLRNEAHSPRTKRGEVRFYHLDLEQSSAAGALTLLVADRSGEEYDEVADEVSRTATMFELRRADTITLLIDGARLCNSAQRHDAIGAPQLIMQGMLEGGVLDHRPRLAVALTKFDAVAAAELTDRVKADFAAILDALRRRFSSSLTEIESFVTAASPKTVDAPRGMGLPELLAYWLKRGEAKPVGMNRVQSSRVFDSFTTGEVE